MHFPLPINVNLSSPLTLLILLAIMLLLIWVLSQITRRRRRRKASYPRSGKVRSHRLPMRRDYGAEIASRHGHQRSPHWGRVEREHRLLEPGCVACGYKGKGLQVHHIHPFHLHPELELDQHNLITLCQVKGRDHHLLLGHLDEWESYNAHVKIDALHFHGKTGAQIRADLRWQKKMQNRPRL